MQFASHGIPRLAARGVPPRSSRGIHIPAIARPPPANARPGTLHKFLQRSQALVSQFVTHLTAPGFSNLRGSSPSLLTRPIHVAARGHQNSIRNGLSLPVRTALSRPLQGPFLPRAPAIPRNIAQVGLGTARNFSSARPIFQNLAQNVPVTGRAFWEADWELKIRKERDTKVRKYSKHQPKKLGGKEMVKPKVERIILQDKPSVAEQTTQYNEMDHYFSAPPVPAVTTFLLIPLAPTPSARFPLCSLDSNHHSLLPWSALANLHASHEMHSLRVSSLFARLDTANVWDRGVSCSAYSHGAAVRDGNGACTILKVEFVGWTTAEVRAVIGESGTGWCVLEEVRHETEDDETSSVFSERSDYLDAQQLNVDTAIDPATSFVLPTLDFSSNFIAASSSELSASEMDVVDHIDLDSFSDTDWDACSHASTDNSLSIQSKSTTSSAGSWFAFSSDFASRASAAKA